MKGSSERIEIKVERLIPASPGETFDGWLDPKIPGNPWNAADKFMLDPKVDGLFYFHLMGTSHYGRFTKLERPARIQHTWVSPGTLGEESTVTLTFREQGTDTLVTLVQSALPETAEARRHEMAHARNNVWKKRIPLKGNEHEVHQGSHRT